MERVPSGHVANRPADAGRDPGPRLPQHLPSPGRVRGMSSPGSQSARDLLRVTQASRLGREQMDLVHAHGNVAGVLHGLLFPRRHCKAICVTVWEQSCPPDRWASSRQTRVEGPGHCWGASPTLPQECVLLRNVLTGGDGRHRSDLGPCVV